MTPENEIPDDILRNALYVMRDPFLTCASIRADDGTITGFRVLFANRAAIGGGLSPGQPPSSTAASCSSPIPPGWRRWSVG